MTLFDFATPTGAKVRCTVCGRTGWGPIDPDPDDPEASAPWQVQCMGGHPFSCDCGLAFTTKGGLYSHLYKRSDHEEVAGGATGA